MRMALTELLSLIELGFRESDGLTLLRTGSDDAGDGGGEGRSIPQASHIRWVGGLTRVQVWQAQEPWVGYMVGSTRSTISPLGVGFRGGGGGGLLDDGIGGGLDAGQLLEDDACGVALSRANSADATCALLFPAAADEAIPPRLPAGFSLLGGT